MESPTALEQKRSNLRRTAIGYIDRALRESRTLRPGEDAELTAIELKIDEIDRTLGRYTRLNSDDRPGATFVRCLFAMAGRRSVQEGVEYATVRRWPEVARALSASVSTAGGFAVPQGYQSDVIQALRPLVSVRRLNPTTVLLADSGNLYWPKINIGASVGYVHENSKITATQEQFGAVTLTARKLAALVPISNTLLRSSSPSATLMVEQDVLAALSSAEDAALLRGDGTQDTPKGLRNWVLPANVFTAQALAGADTDIAKIDGDLSKLEAALINASVKLIRPGWIMSPRTANFLKSLRNSASGMRAFPEMTKNGTLKGYPYAQTANMPVNLGTGTQTEIMLVDMGYVVVGEAPVIINAAGSGAYFDGTNTVSAFAMDQTVVRVILQSDIGMRRAEACAVLTEVNY